MKKLLTLATMVALLLGLASCSSGGDARELLGNVPEKAQAVVVLNIDKMISDADLQTDGDKVELSRQLKQLTADADVNPLDLLSKGAIRHTAAVFFAVDNEPFLTGFIADEKAFVRFFEDAWEDSFGTESGMQVLSKGNNAIAIVDDRFWLTTPAGLDNVRKYMDLDTDRSFAGTGLADELSSADRDIAGCVNISDMLELAQAMGSRSDAASIRQLAAVLDKAEYATFNCRFEKGQILAEAFVYDKKFERIADDGSYFTKINTGTLDCMKGSFDMVMAVGISSKLAGQLGALASMATGASVPGIDAIDGTVAFACNPTETLGSGMPAAMAAVKMKNAQDAQQLGSFLKEGMGTGIGVSMKGSTLLLRTRDFDGKLTAGECLADLNGAYFGYAIAPSLLKKTLPNNTIPFKGASFTLSPDNGSFKMEMKVLTGSDKNSLATIISLLAAMQKENRL